MPMGLSGATDVIMQHIRVRPGTISGQTIDGMGMQGSNHCIMDRCSIVSVLEHDWYLSLIEIDRVGLLMSVFHRARRTISRFNGP